MIIDALYATLSIVDEKRCHERTNIPHGRPWLDRSKRFRTQTQVIPNQIREEFNSFWKWKMQVENESDHILSEGRREEAFERLKPILLSWQTYRGSSNTNTWKTLKESLGNISLAYDRIRRFSLLQLSQIPDEPLQLIWHELGRVKEYRAAKTKNYFVIAVCKPLMLLWGQTLAFDSHVRNNLPTRLHAPYSNRWSYEQWKTVTQGLESEMNKSKADIEYIDRKALERYQTRSLVPYGRFLDMYYF